MIDYHTLIDALEQLDLKRWAQQLPAQIEEGLSTKRFGDLGGWYKALEALPALTPSSLDFAKSAVSFGQRDDCNDQQHQQIKESLEALIPWRKGPFNFFGIDIDTEWRSDWKWDRLTPHISSLKQKMVLDIGCGSGYHCWRMFGEGASRVIGIDPSPRFVVQFYMAKHFAQQSPIDVLPIALEKLPPNLNAFDTTFSMGVLYHRRSPMDHLRELKDTLKPGGELVLETLIIHGELGDTLVPEGRYAKMNNVWFIPSSATLVSWLKKAGFTNVRCVDINQTTLEEQRSTDWMTFQSLNDFLSEDDKNLTIEGHPAPLRGVFVANKPD